MRAVDLVCGQVRLRADVGGPEDGPVVVLSHGGGQTRASWGRATARLADAGLRVVSLDMRGHGDSDWDPHGRYDPASLGSDLVAVARQVGRRVVLVGASMGGHASLMAAEQLGDRVAALVLVDVVPRMEPEGIERITTFMGSHPDGFDTVDDAAVAVAGYLQLPREGGVTDGLLRNLRRRDDGRWRWHWDPALLTQQPRPDSPEGMLLLERAASALRVPVVLLRGLRSDVVSAEGVEALRDLVPQLQVVDLENAAHTAAADDNDAFTQAVLDVTADLSRALP